MGGPDGDEMVTCDPGYLGSIMYWGTPPYYL